MSMFYAKNNYSLSKYYFNLQSEQIDVSAADNQPIFMLARKLKKHYIC
ncbi:hypothetical protein TPHV1_510004 [Treponema phagedenis]|uniref:Uncharacterized protein n=1 Tax=Treponema phagedenis TaxID=162 RepID=A0A0B7GZ77_TREPH|nr:hypothetical protein TPHV1_510004 [Treponema phagedenis]